MLKKKIRRERIIGKIETYRIYIVDEKYRVTDPTGIYAGIGKKMYY